MVIQAVSALIVGDYYMVHFDLADSELAMVCTGSVVETTLIRIQITSGRWFTKCGLIIALVRCAFQCALRATWLKPSYLHAM